MFSSRIIIRSFFAKRNKFADAPNVIRNVGKVVKNRYEVPDSVNKPSYYYKLNKPSLTIGDIEIKDEEKIKSMKKSCKLAAKLLKMCNEIVKVIKVD